MRPFADAAAVTLAAAFVGGPYETHVQPDPDDQRRTLPLLFAGVTSLCRRLGGVATIDDGGDGPPRAVCAWLPSNRHQVGPLDLVRSGLWRVPLPTVMGPAAAYRQIRHERVTDAALHRWVTDDTAYLWALGVDPAHHGSGLGRRAVDLGLEAMRGAGFRWCLLKTETPANVGLYRHLGFEVVADVPDPRAVPAWLLRRPV